jgi:hypothetical protein
MVTRLQLFKLLVCVAISACFSSEVVNPVAAQGTELTKLCVRKSITFVWIRVAPSSDAGVLDTTYPFNCVTRPLYWVNRNTAWDGTQTWVEVTTWVPQGPGWVEQNSMFNPDNATPQPTQTNSTQPTPPTLIANKGLFVRGDVPFVWLRTLPSSYASHMDMTITNHTCQPYAPLAPLSSTDGLYWDGVQWWMQVGVSPEPFVNGWVEFKSLATCP